MGDQCQDRPDHPSDPVSCFWCGQIHPGGQPLSVCPGCQARLSTTRSLETSGSYPKNDDFGGSAVLDNVTRPAA